MKEKFALVQILEFAKFHLETSDTVSEHRRWEWVVKTAFEALGKPSMADKDQIKREAAEQQAYDDLAASGGIVDAP